MGCTSGKTSNPNKNPNSNPVDQRPPLNQNANLPNNNSSTVPSMPVNSNLNSGIQNQPNTNSGAPNQSAMGYNMPNQPQLATSTKPAGQQNLYQGTSGIGYQPESNLNGMNSSIKNPGSAQNLQMSQSHHGNPLGNSQINGSLHNSVYKPNQLETHDTTDDEMVNQEKSMNFDLGIKFNMQIEVE